MSLALEHVKKLCPHLPPIQQDEMVFGVRRRVGELAVKAIAMNPPVIEKIIEYALKEPAPPNETVLFNANKTTMPLTRSIANLFNVLQRERKGAFVPNMKEIQDTLFSRDTTLLGRNARAEDIRVLAFHLSTALNSSAPLSAPVLRVIKEVSGAKVLSIVEEGSTKSRICTTEEWTLNHWTKEFSRYKQYTPDGMSPVIMGLIKIFQKDPKLGLAARADAQGMAELVHRVANDSLIDELKNIPDTTQGEVVRQLMAGDQDGARAAVLEHRNMSRTPRTISIKDANGSTTELDQRGFSM